MPPLLKSIGKQTVGIERLGGGDFELSISSSILPVAAVAVPLRKEPSSLDILYVTLPPEYGNGEWLALTALAASASTT